MSVAYRWFMCVHMGCMYGMSCDDDISLMCLFSTCSVYVVLVTHNVVCAVFVWFRCLCVWCTCGVCVSYVLCVAIFVMHICWCDVCAGVV